MIAALHLAARMINGDWSRISAAGDNVDCYFENKLISRQLDFFALQMSLYNDGARSVAAAAVYAKRHRLKLEPKRRRQLQVALLGDLALAESWY